MPEFIGRKDNRKNDDFVLLQRRREIVKLYLTGRTQWEIALYLRENGWPTITRASVSTDLAWMDKQWLKEIGDDVQEVKAREIARLRLIQTMAFDSFAKSCMDYISEKRTIERAPKFVKEAEKPTKEMEKKLGRKFTKIRGKPVPVEVDLEAPLVPSEEEEMRTLKEVVEISKSGSAGDPRWLSLAKDCSEAILKIYGVGEKATVNNTVNNNVSFWDGIFGRDESQDDRPLENKLLELHKSIPTTTEQETVDAEIIPNTDDEMTLEQILEEATENDNGTAN